MLKSVHELENFDSDSEDDNDSDYELLNKMDLPETVDSQTKQPIIYEIASCAASKIKQGFVTGTSIVGGCATVATMTPYAFRAVSCHLIPSAAVPGVMASTVSGSLTVASYSLGSKAAGAGAEAVASLSSAAMTYLFNQGTNKKNTERKPHIEISNLKPNII